MDPFTRGVPDDSGRGDGLRMFDPDIPITIFQKANVYAILRFLDDSGAVKKSTVKEHVDKGYRTVDQCLVALLELGLVEYIPMDPRDRKGFNLWRITDRGRVVVAAMNLVNEYLKGAGEISFDSSTMEDLPDSPNVGAPPDVRYG